MTTKQRGADASDAPSRTDLYSRITGKIVADLKQGVRPWHRPWNAGNMAGRVTRPLRHNGIPYQGVNTITAHADSGMLNRAMDLSISRCSGPGRASSQHHLNATSW
jgi:hypothetical protein